MAGRCVVFVLGGPGVGKGTQCHLLSSKFFPRVQHFSAGELLRQAAVQDTPQGALIRETLKEGAIVPGEITIGLLQSAIESSSAEIALIDGFPRKIDQGHLFEQNVTPCKFALFFDAPQEEMYQRLLHRAQQSKALGKERSDDNESSIQKRFHIHKQTCLPVAQEYADAGKLLVVPATDSPEEIHQRTLEIFEPLLEGKELPEVFSSSIRRTLEKE